MMNNLLHLFEEDENVWNRFSNNKEELIKITIGIREFIESNENINENDSFMEEEGEEGSILTKTHKFRERNRKIIKRKKKNILEEKGFLSCDVCNFKFEDKYGQYGKDYIECHHTKPVSELRPGQKTKLSDLSLVCSNCHRMIHLKKPWLSIEELRIKLLKS